MTNGEEQQKWPPHSIMVSTGTMVDLENPEISMIHIQDIARSLSRGARFAGHGSHMYTIAQHSVFVAVAADGDDQGLLRRIGILHDASEGYMLDVPKPLKNLIGECYEPYEHNLQSVIFDRFGLTGEDTSKIKYWDNLMYDMEAAALRDNNYAMLQQTNRIVMRTIGVPFADHLLIWPPELAEFIYLMLCERAGIK